MQKSQELRAGGGSSIHWEEDSPGTEGGLAGDTDVSAGRGSVNSHGTYPRNRLSDREHGLVVAQAEGWGDAPEFGG